MSEDVSEEATEEAPTAVSETGVSEEEEPSSAAPKPKRKRHVLRWISLGVAVIVIGGLITGWYKYKRIDDAIHRVPVTDLGPRPPVYADGSMNILVFGSDSRSGLDHHEQVVLHTGGDSNSSGAGNTDTIMLLHISPGRRQVTAMSIPRDTMVPRYECASGPGYRGQAASSSTTRINSLLSAGGPSCLWKTLEQETGIHIDHFLEVGLAGFANVINALGGVEVCAPFNVKDPVSGLTLKEGEQHIDGATALAFWRTREDLGLGSDLQRIQRDQFMSAQVVKGMLSSGLLSNPAKLLQVADGLAPNLTTDSAMSLPDLVSLGESLHSLSGQNVRFVTAPTTPDPANPAAVDFTQPQADELFSAIARDDSAATPSASGTASGTPSPSGTGGSPSPSSSAGAGGVPPGEVKVQVLNGNGMAGIAAVTAGELSSRGFAVVGTGDAPSFDYSSSVIEYASSADRPAARTLRTQVPDAKLREVPGLTSGSVVLILGPGFTDLAPQTSAAASAAGGPGDGGTASRGTASGGTAFGGPAPSPGVAAVPTSAVGSLSPSPAVSSPGSASSPGSGSASPSGSPSETGGVGSVADANGGISASASCRADASAFEGPLSP